MSTLVKIGPLAELPAGRALHYVHRSTHSGDEADGEAIAVCNVGGQLYAMDGICPHSGGPLGFGALDGHLLACPFHAWEFDCRTGLSAVDDHLKLATYPVTVENGQIFVELPFA